MKNNRSPKSSKNETSRLGSQIKLGIDAHARKYVVVMKVDCSSPERPRVFGSVDELAGWIERLKRRCDSVHSCYEAGPLGYVLHRRLAAMGVDSHVIRPIVWDEHGRKVKTDGRDATQMALALDGYLRGNARSFSRIEVPTVAQERERALARQRQALAKERRRLCSMGRSHVLFHEGRTLRGEWWKPRRWKELAGELGEFLSGLLAPLRGLILAVDERLKAATETMAKAEVPELPKGMGPVLFRQIEGEVRDWASFKDRRAIAGYTGLCPGEHTSAARRMLGSVTKHGNPRLRAMLVELAWLLMRWNPGYSAVEKWRARLEDPKATKPSRKKAAVAIARQFAVDWWRIRAGRATPQELGLEMKPASAAL